MTTLGVILLSK